MGAGAITVCQNKTAVKLKEDVKRIMAQPLGGQRTCSAGKVFGVSLYDLQQRGQTVDSIPLAVRHMVEYLRQYDHNGNREELRWLLQQLPEVNYCLLKFLCHFLTLVAAEHRTNRMTVYNLATVFGPNIFHVSAGFEGIQEQNISNKLMASLLENYDIFFENTDKVDVSPGTGTQTRIITVQEASSDVSFPTSVCSVPSAASTTEATRPLPRKKKNKRTRPKVIPGTFLVPQPEQSIGTPDTTRTLPVRRASQEEMESSEELASSIKDMEINSSQDDDRPMSPFYLSTHVSPINNNSSAGDFIERTIRSAVEQHLFDSHGSGGQSPEESESGTSLLSAVGCARQRRRHLKEQDEPWRSRETDDINKENIPSAFSGNEENRSGLVEPSQQGDKKLKETNSSYIEEGMKPKRQKSSCKLSELNKNQDSPMPMESSSVSSSWTSDPGHRGSLSFQTHSDDVTEHERKESALCDGDSYDHIKLTLNTAMKIQEPPSQSDVARTPRTPEPATAEGSSTLEIPRLDLTGLSEDKELGEAGPALQMWKSPDAESEEARLSPQAGRLIRQLLEEDSDPMLSPRFYAYSQSQQFLNDTEVPPSPPNSHSFMRPRSSSLGSYDDEREELTPAQMTRRIQNLKKKIRRFEQKFEEERRYRPSHSDKATNPEVLKWMNELTKLRKQLKDAKLKVPEEDIIPQVRQRSNTLPKSFGSQLERGPEKEQDKKQEVAEKVQKPSVETTLDTILKKLQEKRAEVNRPEDIKDMTRDEIANEKVALQKGLLYYESIHGRPVTKAERQIMMPLYDRYRLVKQILSRANTIPVIGSPSSKRRSPLLKPIIEGETASFFEDLKEEEDGTEDDGNPKMDFAVTAKPGFTIRSFLDQLDDSMDAFTPPVNERTPARCSLDLRLSNLHSASMPELLEQLQEARADKKRLRKTLRDFEDTFFQENGRNVQKEDREPMAEEYNEYKHVKAKLKLLEVLISKQDSSKVI
ncbi:protein FAM13A isoform X4 [Mobula birostris]|uniref:protein FAM13A isoform X4 n=1 Tax=Mobula birostris TaxID=1983395 RepID=UPI003B2884D6